jgi:hypothetical protein
MKVDLSLFRSLCRRVVFVGLVLFGQTSIVRAEAAQAFPDGFSVDVRTSCRDASECGCGSTCEFGNCVARELPSRCSVDADCLACTGRVCERGVCHTPTADPNCAGRTCPGCQVCLNRVGCTVPDNTLCSSNAECGQGALCNQDNPRRCVRRFAALECVNDDECVPCNGQLCARRRCRSVQGDSTCRTNGDCRVGLLCLERIGCVSPLSVPCTSATECGPGFRCDAEQRLCRVAQVGDVCEQESDCATGGLLCVQQACAQRPASPPRMDGSVLDARGSTDSGGPVVLDAGCRCRVGAGPLPTFGRGSALLVLACATWLAGRRRRED